MAPVIGDAVAASCTCHVESLAPAGNHCNLTPAPWHANAAAPEPPPPPARPSRLPTVLSHPAAMVSDEDDSKRPETAFQMFLVHDSSQWSPRRHSFRPRGPLGADRAALPPSPLETPSPRALQWQRHRLRPRSAPLHRGPPCATATDGFSPRSQPKPRSQPRIVAPDRPLHGHCSIRGPRPRPDNRGPTISASRRQMSPAPTTPRALQHEPHPVRSASRDAAARVGSATAPHPCGSRRAPRPRATSRTRTGSPEPPQCLGATSRTQQPPLGHARRSWLAHDLACNVTLQPAMASLTRFRKPTIRLMRCAQRLALSCVVPKERSD
jgi:hypothetical protein